METISEKEKEKWKTLGQKLMEKNTLIETQKESIDNMINSPDTENFVLAKELIRLKISETLVKGLNDGQAYAFTKIIDFFRDSNGHTGIVLKGFAGTGKTYLVKRVIEYISIAHPSHKVAITAPTNKAVHVLHKNSPFGDKTAVFEDYGRPKDKLVYCTIHKLLNLKEQISDTGVRTFVTEVKGKNDIDQYRYIIVDEVSMLDDNLFLQLMKFRDKIKFIFMGDPCQIPPVNKNDCIPFRSTNTFNLLQLELSKIMRQQGEHPIIDAGFVLRTNLQLPSPLGKISTSLNAVGHGIIHIDAKTNRKHTRTIIEKYFKNPEFQQNTDFIKIIAWTNNTVKALNNIVREILFGKDSELYVVGDKIVANKAIFTKVDGKFGKFYAIQANTSDEFTIVNVEVKEKYFIETPDYTRERVKVYLKYWSLTVERQNKEKITLSVIHQDSRAMYDELLKELKKKAQKARLSTLWMLYYDVMKWEADIVHNYAISAHKSQGSTYKNVILIEEDLNKNTKIVERNRIKYTAYTRATDRLYILS